MDVNDELAARPVGRILIKGRDAGSAFTVAPRVALTAGHVVRAVAGNSAGMDDVVYVPEGGSPIAIVRVEVDRVLDVAVVHLDAAAPEMLSIAQAVDGMRWRVQTRPLPNDPTLTGTVTDHLRALRNDQGEDTHLVQLWVQQEVGDFAGYSGSPVTLQGPPLGAVIGVLVEQGRWRKSPQSGQRTPVSNVLYAAPIEAVVSRFGLRDLIRNPVSAIGFGAPPAADDLLEIPLLGDRLPRLRDLSPYRLGTTPSDYGNLHQRRDPYVRRSADAQLRSAAAEYYFVLVVGPSLAGKSRTTYEAALAEWPNARLLVPKPGIGALPALADHPMLTAEPDAVVVWLDDIHRFLVASEHLNLGLLDRFIRRPGRTLVLATLRSEYRRRYRDSKGEMDRSVTQLFGAAIEISLAGSLDNRERNDAKSAYPKEDFSLAGIGERLASAPDLRSRYHDASPLQISVVRAAIDWVRVGMLRAIPEVDLLQLARHYAYEAAPECDLSEDALVSALRWAELKVGGERGHVALLTVERQADRSRAYRPFDYSVAMDEGQDWQFRPIPDIAWEYAVSQATVEDRLSIAEALFLRGRTVQAEQVMRPAADAGNVEAMTNIAGIALADPKRLDEAEGLLRRAATAGGVQGMAELGVILGAYRGKMREAKKWLQRAAESGDPSAMNNLGLVFYLRKEYSEAEIWLRRAVDASFVLGRYNLGRLLLDLGRFEEARTWWQRAAEAGNIAAMYNLGMLDEWQGNLDEARGWLHKAAEFGDLDAIMHLGRLAHESGNLDEAENWMRRAADTGDLDSMHNLAFFYHERGNLADAKTWWRLTAQAGGPNALFDLGLVHSELKEFDEAETWYRRAADSGDARAMNNLAFLYDERGDRQQAITWWRHAARAGHRGAAKMLRDLAKADRDHAGRNAWPWRSISLRRVLRRRTK